MVPYESKLSPELRRVALEERRPPSVIVRSAEGVPAASGLTAAAFYDATERLFAESEAPQHADAA